MSTQDTQTVRQVNTSWGLRLILLVVVGISGALISHNWESSLVFNENLDLLAHERENVFIDQQANTSIRSATGYLLLGFTGIYCLVGSRWNSLRWLHPLSFLFLAFVAWAALSLLWSDTPELSFRKMSILALVSLAAYGIASRISLLEIMWLTAAYFGIALLLGIVSEVTQGVFRPWVTGYRLVGTQHPNTIGMNASILCLAAGLLAWQARYSRWLLALVFVFGFFVLLLSKSRTSLAAFLASALVVVLLKTPAQFRLMIGSLAVGFVCIAGIASNFANTQDIGEVTAAASLGRSDNIGSLTGRLPLWNEMLKFADDHPLLGFGYGSFWSAKRIDDFSEKLLWEIPNGHNAYLDLLLNLGIVGLSLYAAWLLVMAITGTQRFLRDGGNGELFAVGLAVFLMIHALAESLILAQGIPSLLLLTCSARLALYPSEQRALVGPDLIRSNSKSSEAASPSAAVDNLVT